MKAQVFSFKTDLMGNKKLSESVAFQGKNTEYMFEDKPCKTTSAMTSLFSPRQDHSMKLDQEHQHSMSQNVDQHSEHIRDSRKDNKVKLKMTMHIVHKKSGMCM